MLSSLWACVSSDSTTENYAHSNTEDVYSITYGGSQSTYDAYGGTSNPSNATSWHVGCNDPSNYSSSYSSYMTEATADSNAYYRYNTTATYNSDGFNPNTYDETGTAGYSTQVSNGNDTNYNTYSSYSIYDTQMKAGSFLFGTFRFFLGLTSEGFTF